MPPSSILELGKGTRTPEQQKRLEEHTKIIERAVCRVRYAPDQLTLYYLFLTDFSAEPNSMTNYDSFELTNNQTKVKTSVGYAVVDQLEPSTRFLAFYISPTTETPGLTVGLSDQYHVALNDWWEKGEFTAKVPGDSEQMSSKDLRFTGRIYVYHETYMSPSDTIRVSKTFKGKGLSVILRSSDYLANKKLEYKLRVAKSKTE